MKVNQHAINRFRERTGCKQPDEYIRDKLLEMQGKSKEAEFTHPRHVMFALFNHNFERARYFMYNNFLIVVVNGEIKTIHNNEARRWKVKDVSHEKFPVKGGNMPEHETERLQVDGLDIYCMAKIIGTDHFRYFLMHDGRPEEFPFGSIDNPNENGDYIARTYGGQKNLGKDFTHEEAIRWLLETRRQHA